ncbi:hypothetical protein Tco_0702562 [Tanacetum coccineum]|uniref:Uncharacterized protein n=1 Tax=Tanacetum coccineum TaxID=301880 RepID=A0ABQ4XXY3_9ASTR
MMLTIRRYLMSSKRMANEAFIGGYHQAFVNFLPYLTSDHSAAMLVIPNGRSKKIKPFRFANYVVDKPEFLDIVNNCVNGFAMFKLVKKLKNMKTHMNKLNWKHGNLFKSAKQLKEDLKMAQKEFDRYPYGAVIKANEVCLLEKYMEAVEDEEKLLFQMAKVEWLSKAMEMIKEVTDKEIKDAMFDIGDTKSPGPNGYSAMFFKKSRGIIGDNVFSLIMAKKFKDNKDFSVIKEALDEFSKVSGLIPSIGKSTIFFSNVDVGEIQQILDNLPFLVGKLPMKYLGVRLISKKLNVNDCTPLIDKVKNKVLYWKNKV